MKKPTASIGTAALATASAPKKRISQAQSERIALLDAHWTNLSAEAQAAWNAVGARRQAFFGQPGDAVTPGYVAFFACNSALLAAGCPLAHAVPQSSTLLLPLPPLRVAIAFAGAHPVMTLVPERAVPAGPKLVLWATEAASPGSSTASARAFCRIGVLTEGIPLVGTEIAGHYLSVFPAPPPSSQIAFKVTAIGEDGFVASTVDTTGIAPALALTADAANEKSGLRAA